MSPERIAELRAVPRPSFTNDMRAELLDEIERLQALIASRPPTHVLHCEAGKWSAAHPIDCAVHDCAVVNEDIAYDVLLEFGEGVYEHDPATGVWMATA